MPIPEEIWNKIQGFYDNVCPEPAAQYAAMLLIKHCSDYLNIHDEIHEQTEEFSVVVTREDKIIDLTVFVALAIGEAKSLGESSEQYIARLKLVAARLHRSPDLKVVT